MPHRPPRVCNQAMCGELSVPGGGYCQDHQAVRKKQRRSDKHRPSARQRGYTRDWEKARAAWLIDQPFCANKRKHGQRLVEGEVVDHKVPHRGDKQLFWDKRNWQTLCTPCHNEKTAREDGGFGNAKRVP